MNDLSPTTRALLRAAREDGPGSAARSNIWSGVAAKAAGGAAVGAGSAAAASAGAAKLLVMGALLGSAVTVGIAAMLLHVSTPSLRADPADGVHADTESAAIAPATHATAASMSDRTAPLPAAPSRRALPRAVAAEDTLDREAALVAEARGAIVRGEPEAALGALRAAHALRANALEPEEFSLEARALYALGRDREAKAVEERLRARFPDHALAR